MAGTYTNLLYHVVFSTKSREPMIYGFKDRLYTYMGGIVRGKEGKLLAIGGTADHVHLAVKLKPTEAVSKTVGEIKGNSSKWINENGFLEGYFSWQVGFGAFSVSESAHEAVVAYIDSQESHHRKQSFKDEFIALLEKHNIEYDPARIWD